MKFEISRYFRRITQSNFIIIRPLGAEMFHAYTWINMALFVILRTPRKFILFLRNTA